MDERPGASGLIYVGGGEIPVKQAWDDRHERRLESLTSGV